MLVIAILSSAFSIQRAITGPGWLWFATAIWVTLGLVSLRRILRARRTRREFELKHGSDAGVRF